MRVLLAALATLATFAPLAACSRAPATTTPSLASAASAAWTASTLASTSASAPPEPPPSSDAHPFALVELFTSEGCSSCPPADAVLRDLAVAKGARSASRDVYALSFHVDYWNELGWPDRFSQGAFTARQRAYANARHERSVYTPQMLVNGREELNGGDAAGARRAIDHALHAEPSRVGLAATVAAPAESDVVAVRFSTTGAPSDAILYVALVEPFATSRVTRGENAGKTLDHANVVRALDAAPLAVPSGVRTLALPRDVPRESVEVVAWVQVPATMQVLAATRAR